MIREEIEFDANSYHATELLAREEGMQVKQWLRYIIQRALQRISPNTGRQYSLDDIEPWVGCIRGPESGVSFAALQHNDIYDYVMPRPDDNSVR